jgi:glycosyltransferase involved in cell wall biosynthesis
VRLLVVSQMFWPEDFRINELVEELVARGHEVTILTGTPNYPAGVAFPEFVANPEKFASYAGARVIRVPMLTRGQGKLRLMLNYAAFAVSATVAGVVRFRRDDFDAIFVFEPSPVTVGVPAIALRALHKWPIAFWILDQWPETLKAVGVIRSDRALRVVGAGVRFIYTRCDVLLTTSRSLVSRIATYCRPGQRIEYFPNWIEAAYESADAEPAPEVPTLPGAFNVMFAGNIGDAQDFPAILDAAERLRDRTDIRWLIVGDGRVAAWVRDEIVRRNLANNVMMLGRFPTDRMPSFFRHADALLVSLRSDPLFAMTAPGKIQSYLASGRPVLAMLDGESASVIDEARAGFTAPAGDGTRLAENVLKLSALSEDARAQLGRNGVEFARREFSRAALVDRLETWLSEIVAAPARSPEGANAGRQL